MIKTTVYLPDELKRALERAAVREARSEAELVRDAIRQRVDAPPGRSPRLPLVEDTPDDPTIADRVDDILATGFGR